MEWAIRQHTIEEIDAAGLGLVKRKYSAEELDHILGVINNWRASHSFPLNTFQCTLRRKARQIDHNPLIAQRLKRLSSIYEKLKRMRRLTLSEMQDIGGCRAIVGSVDHVRQLVDLYKSGDIKHKLDQENDYIGIPKPSGYRGVHLIYRYFSDRNKTYNGQKIEMQLRSRLQHAWATAVETVGAFTRQALKTSQGEKQWLRFFALMGTDIALREKTAPVPDTPTNNAELRQELREYAEKLDVEQRLHAFGTAVHATETASKDAHYFLLRLDPSTKQLSIRGYLFAERDKASSDYLATERAIQQSGADAVLVSVESLEALRRAYPNYFLDTDVFIELVKKAIAE
jgi:ppGpp synthetase/RelA/SpoT-type nucleotidyltranferase